MLYQLDRHTVQVVPPELLSNKTKLTPPLFPYHIMQDDFVAPINYYYSVCHLTTHA